MQDEEVADSIDIRRQEGQEEGVDVGYEPDRSGGGGIGIGGCSLLT